MRSRAGTFRSVRERILISIADRGAEQQKRGFVEPQLAAASMSFQFNLSQMRRGTRLSALFFLVGLLVAYKISGYILAEDTTSLMFVGLAFVGGAVVIAILNDWTKGVYLSLGWLVFEDLARKFLGNNMALYFAKDLLFATVYLSFFVAWRNKHKPIETFRPPFRIALMALVWFGLVQVFNPASTHIVFGLMGMKLYFYYVPLMLVAYALIDSETALRRFFFFNLGLIVAIALLGIIQSIVGPQFLNPAVLPADIRALSENYRVAPISGVRVYRPTSIFVGGGRFADFLLLSWFIVFGFTGYLLLRHRRGRVFAFITFAVTAAACLMCASRGVFMWSVIAAVVGGLAFVWGAPWRQGEALRVIRILQRASLGTALAVFVLLFAFPEAFLNRIAVYSETLDPRSPASELVRRSHDYPMQNFLGAFDFDRWPYGYGIGTASLGVQYVSRFFEVSPPEGGVESGYGVIVLEMGIGGLFLWFAMSIAVVTSGWKVVRGLKGSPFFPLAFMILLYAFVLLVPMTFTGMQQYQDFILNSYLWLLLGILFRLPKLALAAQPGVPQAEVIPGPFRAG